MAKIRYSFKLFQCMIGIYNKTFLCVLAACRDIDLAGEGELLIERANA